MNIVKITETTKYFVVKMLLKKKGPQLLETLKLREIRTISQL